MFQRVQGYELFCRGWRSSFFVGIFMVDIINIIVVIIITIINV